MDFHNLVLTFLYGMKCQCVALVLDGTKVWTRQATCKQSRCGWYGSYKVKSAYVDKFTASTCSWAATLASTWEMRVRRSVDTYGSPKEKAKPKFCERDLTPKI